MPLFLPPAQDALERNAAAAEELRSRPPLYTTMRTDHAFDERSIYTTAPITLEGRMQNLVNEEKAKANMLARNRIMLDAYAVQNRLVNSLNTLQVDTSAPGWDDTVDPATGLPRFLTNGVDPSAPCPVIPLPADAVIAHATNAQSRTDLVAIQVRGGPRSPGKSPGSGGGAV